MWQLPCQLPCNDVVSSTTEVVPTSDQALAYHCLGILEHSEENANGARLAFAKALELDPQRADSWSNLGLVLHQLDDLSGAERAVQRCLTLVPEQIEALYLQGVLLRARGQWQVAAASWQQLLALAPEHAKAWNQLAAFFQERCQLQEAEDCFNQARQAAPQSEHYWSNYLFNSNYRPEVSPRELFQRYQDWQKQRALPEQPFHVLDSQPWRRLKVAYISADFCRHSARHFILPLLQQHRREQVEVYLYSHGRKQDEWTEAYRRCADHWRDIETLDDQQLLQTVKADQIDILVDLSGHTAGNRLRALSQRLAPVQVSWLGYGYTTGLSAMDYFIGDEQFLPRQFQPATSDLFSEGIVRLPDTAFVYQPDSQMPEPGPLPAESKGYVTFGSFNRAIRYNDGVIAVWAEILNRVPNSRLWLNAAAFTDPDNCEHYLRQFEACGIERQRLRLDFTQPQSSTWQAYQQVDIALDPFPHNGGVTTFEALWMGVPVLTMKHRPALGCLGASVLHQLQLDDWITDSAQAYVERAVDVASDVAALATLRGQLRQRMQQSSLMDAKTFAEDFESAYRTMWLRVCLGLAAVDLDLAQLPTASQQLLNLGVCAQRSGVVSLAQRCFDWLLQVEPEHHQALQLAAMAALQEGQFDDSQRLMRRACDLSPDDPLLWNNLGLIMAQAKQFEAAMGAYQQAIELDADNAEAHVNLAMSQWSGGHEQAGIHTLTVFLQRCPDELRAAQHLGVMYLRRQAPQLAEGYFRQVLAARPEQASAYKNLADALLAQGQRDLALPLYHQAADRDPRYQTVLQTMRGDR